MNRLCNRFIGSFPVRIQIDFMVAFRQTQFIEAAAYFPVFIEAIAFDADLETAEIVGIFAEHGPVNERAGSDGDFPEILVLVFFDKYRGFTMINTGSSSVWQ